MTITTVESSDPVTPSSDAAAVVAMAAGAIVKQEEADSVDVTTQSINNQVNISIDHIEGFEDKNSIQNESHSVLSDDSNYNCKKNIKDKATNLQRRSFVQSIRNIKSPTLMFSNKTINTSTNMMNETNPSDSSEEGTIKSGIPSPHTLPTIDSELAGIYDEPTSIENCNNSKDNRSRSSLHNSKNCDKDDNAKIKNRRKKCIVILAFVGLIIGIAVIVIVAVMYTKNQKTSSSASASVVETSVPTFQPTITQYPSTVPSSVPTNGPTITEQPSDSPTSSPSTTTSPTDTVQVTTFYAIGDVPYAERELVKLRAQMANITDDAEFVIHIGDMRFAKPGLKCVEKDYTTVADALRLSRAPVFIIMGDNDWVDCSNPDDGYRLWNQEFLHFPSRYWNHKFNIITQPDRPANFAFVHKQTLFLGLNLIGGRVKNKTEWAARLSSEASWSLELMRDFILSTRSGSGIGTISGTNAFTGTPDTTRFNQNATPTLATAIGTALKNTTSIPATSTTLQNNTVVQSRRSRSRTSRLQATTNTSSTDTDTTNSSSSENSTNSEQSSKDSSSRTTLDTPRIVIFGHANPYYEHRTFFDPLVNYIKNEIGNSVPILYLNGDKHVWEHQTNFYGQDSMLRIMVNAKAEDPPLQVQVHATGYYDDVRSAFQYDRMLPPDHPAYGLSEDEQNRIGENSSKTSNRKE
jgi:hypothetical protein